MHKLYSKIPSNIAVSFYVLLTVHLSTILVINQLNAQIIQQNTIKHSCEFLCIADRASQYNLSN